MGTEPVIHTQRPTPGYPAIRETKSAGYAACVAARDRCNHELPPSDGLFSPHGNLSILSIDVCMAIERLAMAELP